MKKLISVFTILCFFGTAVVAQDNEGKNELRVGFSDALPITIGDALLTVLGDAFTSTITGYTKETLNQKNSGMWSIGYKHHFSNRFSLGADVGLLKSSKDFKFTKGAESYLVQRKSSFLLFMPTAQYNYLNKEKVQLYGNVGAGVLSYSVDETKSDDTSYSEKFTSFAFQVNPIGLRVGKQFAGFAELGFGYKGIIGLGFSYRF